MHQTGSCHRRRQANGSNEQYADEIARHDRAGYQRANPGDGGYDALALIQQVRRDPL